MACMNHVFDVQIGYLADDEGRDWLIAGCQCGARTATLMVSGSVSQGNGEMPAVVYAHLHDQPKDEVLQKYHSDAEQCLDKEK